MAYRGQQGRRTRSQTQQINQQQEQQYPGYEQYSQPAPQWNAPGYGQMAGWGGPSGGWEQQQQRQYQGGAGFPPGYGDYNSGWHASQSHHPQQQQQQQQNGRWHGERRQHPQASDYPATPFDGPPSHHYNSSGYGQQYGNSPQNHHHHRIPSLTPLHPTPPLHAHHHTNAGPSGHHGHAQAPNDNGEQPVKKFHKKKERARALRELKEAAAALGTSAPSSFTDSSVPTSHGESPQPYQRRKKQARDAPPPVPSAAYLATTQEAVSPAAADAPPPLLILDLNNTLLMRKTRDAVGSKSPIARPYLSTFLQYACGKDATTGQRRWDAVVYSSARSHNVLSLLMATRLVPIERAKTVKRGDAWEAKEGEALRYVQTRENMGLTAKEYDADVETVKDLSKIWETLSGTGSERTVLLDDEAGKAGLQPYNHLPIEPFLVDPNTLPRSTSRASSPAPNAPVEHPTELPSSHPFANDTALLSTIYELDQLRQQANIGAFIRNRGVKLGFRVEKERRAEEGRKVCEREGIEVKREWEGEWWEKCEGKVEKEE